MNPHDALRTVRLSFSCCAWAQTTPPVFSSQKDDGYRGIWFRLGQKSEFGDKYSGGDVDKRTDLFYLQTDDLGRTWRNAAGQAVAVPLTDPKNPALVRDYAAEKRLVYIHASHIFFTNQAGDRVWQLPYDMAEAFAKPQEIVR